MRIAILILFSTLGLLCCNRRIPKDGLSVAERIQDTSELVGVAPLIEPLSACEGFKFASPQDQADSLVAIYEKSILSGNETQNVNWAFFCCFPETFAEMQQIFGYHDTYGAAPLYSDGEQIIAHFSKLTAIPKEVYYDKYVSINIDGKWEADNIRDAFGLAEHIKNNATKVCHSLLKRTDDEIESVFRFIFDGPHPVNQVNEDIYKELLPLLESENKKLSRLFSEAYTKVLATDDGHGR